MHTPTDNKGSHILNRNNSKLTNKITYHRRIIRNIPEDTKYSKDLSKKRGTMKQKASRRRRIKRSAGIIGINGEVGIVLPIIS